MEKELATFCTYLEDVEVEIVREVKVYLGKLEQRKIILAKSGIGKVAAASLLTMLIERYHPSLVINMGIAGAYDQRLQTLDTVIATKAVYSDADMTADAFTDLRYGQIEGTPPYFEVDTSLLEMIPQDIKEGVYFGMIASGDQFVTSYKKCRDLVETHFKEEEILAFDMESAAILHVCSLYHLPCLILRTISDLIGSTNALDYNVFSIEASQKVNKICYTILKKMEK